MEYRKEFKMYFKTGNSKMMPNKAERLYLLGEVGVNAYLLYEEYLRRKSTSSFADKDLQKVMPYFSERTIASARKALVTSGFYEEDKMYSSTGRVKHIRILLGKPGVSNKTELAKRNKFKTPLSEKRMLQNEN